MKRFSEQFKKKSDTIRLRASERADLRDRLVSYMEYHPLPDAPKKAATSVASPYFIESFIKVLFAVNYQKHLVPTIS